MANGQITKVLEDARKLIEKPENWIQRAYYAINNEGKESYCASGALHLAAGAARITQQKEMRFSLVNGFAGFDAAEYFMRANNIDRNRSYVSHFNDNHTHAEILAAFDRAIEQAKKENA